MSGIVAVVNFDGEPVDPEILRKMAEQCAYRGPDGIRYWIQGNVGMAHLALHSTPESLREVQPMLSADGSLCLTADVRVDNRPELIALLQAKGQPVNNDSTDADLVLASYQVWGEHCPEQIIGDYAFAIWDVREQRLFCARDIYGVKSLHYTRIGATLCVASEAQQIIQHPKVPRVLDEIAVADFLVRNFNDEERTMFAGVWAVKRASYLVGNPAGQRMERYWDIDPNYRITYKTDEEYAAHFLEIFQRAVSDRLRTQGKTIGITMSGGMDSTSVAAVAQKILADQPVWPHLLVCSYTFDALQGYDETYYIKSMAEELGLDLIYVPAEKFWFLDDDEIFTPSLETPYLSEESLTCHVLKTFSAKGGRVWLTGHGGDNLLAGSPLVYADRLRRGEIRVIWETTYLWKQFDLPISRLLQTYRNWLFGPLVPETIRSVFGKKSEPEIPDWLNANFARRTHIAERLLDVHYPLRFNEEARQANYVSAVWSNTVRFSIYRAERLGAQFCMEARHPMLDRRLAEFLMAIPANQLFRDGLGKFILRKAMRGILPEVVRTRTKTALVPNYLGLKLTKESGKIKALMESPLQGRLNWVQSKKIQDDYQNYLLRGGVRDLPGNRSIISLELWLKNYLQDFLVEE